jgi:enediyne biosynthesis protein E4
MPFRFPSLLSRGAICAAGVVAVAVVAGWLAFRSRSDEPAPRELPPAGSRDFRECATEVGITWRMNFLPNEQGEKFKINLYDHGSGLAVGDFDGDGKDDIYFCNQVGKNALYRNNGDGTFSDVAEQAGVALGDRVCVAATFADYDNDGKPDLFVTSTRGGNVMFHNLGNGRFEDVTAKVGLTHVGHSQSAVFFDYDNDGFLDLLLTNTAAWTSDEFDTTAGYWVGKELLGGVILSPKEYNVLYHNEPVDPADPSKGRKFVDVTAKAGLKGRGWAGDAVAFDYNDDGHMDLYVTSMFGRGQLYKNNGNGTFTDVTLDVLGRTSWGAIGAQVLDFNNDGRLDLYAVDMHSDMWMGLDLAHSSLEMARGWEKKKFSHLYGPLVFKNPAFIEQEEELGRKIGFKHEEVIFGNTLFRNEGGGKFREVSDEAGVETFWPWGIATGDFTNGGYEDVFIPSGMGYPFYYWPNYLLSNQGDGTFRNRAEEMGIEPPPRGKLFPNRINGREATRSSRCAATADFRGVGRLDIVVNNFNDQPYYFKNESPPKNWVAFRLTGTKCNRDAIGAVVRLYQGDKVMTRQVQGGGGYLSQSSRTLHFGLGVRAKYDRAEVRWPGTTAWLPIEQTAINTRHDLTQE